MCMKTPKAAPIPQAAPQAEAAPDEIKNTEGSNANQQKKKRQGKKAFRKNKAGINIGTVSGGTPSSPNVGG